MEYAIKRLELAPVTQQRMDLLASRTIPPTIVMLSTFALATEDA